MLVKILLKWQLHPGENAIQGLYISNGDIIIIDLQLLNYGCPVVWDNKNSK